MNDDIRLMEIAKDLTLAIAGQKSFLVGEKTGQVHVLILNTFKECLKVVREESISKNTPGAQS